MHAPTPETYETDVNATVNPAIDELNRVVQQAEALLCDIGHETGEAAEAVRERVTQTLNQARARLAATASHASEVAESLADRADRYVRENPWQSVAIAAVVGGAVTLLLSKLARQ